MEAKELSKSGEDWEIQRDGMKGKMEYPLLAHEECNAVREITCLELDNWGELVIEGNGPMLKW